MQGQLPDQAGPARCGSGTSRASCGACGTSAGGRAERCPRCGLQVWNPFPTEISAIEVPVEQVAERSQSVSHRHGIRGPVWVEDSEWTCGSPTERAEGKAMVRISPTTCKRRGAQRKLKSRAWLGWWEILEPSTPRTGGPKCPPVFLLRLGRAVPSRACRPLKCCLPPGRRSLPPSSGSQPCDMNQVPHLLSPIGMEDYTSLDATSFWQVQWPTQPANYWLKTEASSVPAACSEPRPLPFDSLKRSLAVQAPFRARSLDLQLLPGTARAFCHLTAS